MACLQKFQSHINSTAVIRLHGPDRAGMEEKTHNVWNKIIEPKDDEINLVADMIHSLTQKDVDLYLNINNHYEGSAPLTIEKLKQQIKF